MKALRVGIVGSGFGVKRTDELLELTVLFTQLAPLSNPRVPSLPKRFFQA